MAHQRTAEEERAYWEREAQIVEQGNRRNEMAQAISNAQAEVFRSTIKTIQAVDLTIFVVVLMIVALVVLLLVKLGIYISGIV